MADWKFRATPVSDSPSSDWKARAKSLSPEDQGSDLADLGAGAMQGATAGFGDELLAGRDAIDQKAQELVGMKPSSNESLADLYRRLQQENQGKNEEHQKRSPYLYGGGQLAGGIAPAIATMGGSAEAEALPLLAKMANGVKTGAGIGAISGLGNSKNTIENPEGLVKDAASDAALGAVTGGLVPAALSGAKKVAGTIGDAGSFVSNKLGQMVDDSPSLSPLKELMNYKRKTGMDFTGNKAVQNIENNANATVDRLGDTIAGVKKNASQLYGQTLQDAGAKGSLVDTAEPELNEALTTANKAINGSEEASGRGGMNKDMRSLLQRALSPEGISPQEAKTLQNALRDTAGTKGYMNDNTVSDAAQALTPAIEKSLPDSVLSNLNSTYKGGMQSIEPFLNSGEGNAAQQKVSASELSPDEIKQKSADYFNNVINRYKDSNIKGAETKANFGRALQASDDASTNAQTNFLDTNQIGQDVNNSAIEKNAIKKIYGERANGLSSDGGMISKLGNMVTGSPYRAALGVGAVQRAADKTASLVGNAGRNLYQATDDVLNGVASHLADSGHTDIAQHLSNALANKSDTAKNAALFTILSNPTYSSSLGSQQPDQNSQ